MGTSQDIGEEGGGPAFSRSEGQDTPLAGGSTGGYIPSPRDVRRDAIYQAIGSFGPEGAPTTKAIVDRAQAIVNFTIGDDD